MKCLQINRKWAKNMSRQFTKGKPKISSDKKEVFSNLCQLKQQCDFLCLYFYKNTTFPFFKLHASILTELHWKYVFLNIINGSLNWFRLSGKYINRHQDPYFFKKKKIYF